MTIGAVGSAHYAVNREVDVGERGEIEPVNADAAPIEGESLRETSLLAGETLWDLAQYYKIPLPDLKAANPQIADPELVYPGERVKLPSRSQPAKSAADSGTRLESSGVGGPARPRQTTVMRGETFSGIALFYQKRYGVDPADLRAANPKIKNVNRLREGETLFLPALAAPDKPRAVLTKPDAKSAIADKTPSALPEPLLVAAKAARNQAPEPSAKTTSWNPLPDPIPRLLTPIDTGFNGLAGPLGAGFDSLPGVGQGVVTLGTCSLMFDLATSGKTAAGKEHYIRALGDFAGAGLSMIRCGARAADVLDIFEGNAKLTDLFPSDWGIAAVTALAVFGPRVLQDAWDLGTLPESATPVATHIAVRKLIADALRGTATMIRGAPAIIKLGAATVPVLAAFTGLALLDLVDRLTTESPQERAAWVQAMKDLEVIPRDMPDPWSDFSGGTLERFADGIVHLGLKFAEQMGSAGAVEDLQARAVYSATEDQVRAMQWAEEEFTESVAEGRPLNPAQLESDFKWDAFWRLSLDSDKKSEAFAHLEKLRTSWQQSPTLPLDRNLERAIVIAANLYLEEHGKAWKFIDAQILHPPERRELNRYLDQALGPLEYSEDEAPLILGLLKELRRSQAASKAATS